jgi:hypothetical protein
MAVLERPMQFRYSREKIGRSMKVLGLELVKGRVAEAGLLIFLSRVAQRPK